MTNKQKQCLMEYLGYYTSGKFMTDKNEGESWNLASETATRLFQRDYGLVMDGIFGPETEARVRAVVASGELPEINWNEVKYFGRQDFRCKCGGANCNGFPVEPHPVLVRLLERVCDHYEVAAMIRFGVCCEAYNANAGDDLNSRHVYGKAVDFCIKGVNTAALLEYVWKQPEVLYASVIGKDYIHMAIE